MSEISVVLLTDIVIMPEHVRLQHAICICVRMGTYVLLNNICQRLGKSLLRSWSRCLFKGDKIQIKTKSCHDLPDAELLSDFRLDISCVAKLVIDTLN